MAQVMQMQAVDPGVLERQQPEVTEVRPAQPTT
jgi:hypothetical protein